MSAKYDKVANILASNKKALIKLTRDESCEMAMVELNGECIGSGNYWDFDPSYEQLIDVLVSMAKQVGKPFEIIREDKPFRNGAGWL